MSPSDLICSRDGSMSLTKLAAATAHGLFALTVAYVTWLKQDFVTEMWMLYIGATIAHAGYDKTLATVQDMRRARHVPESSPAATEAGAAVAVYGGPRTE